MTVRRAQDLAAVLRRAGYVIHCGAGSTPAEVFTADSVQSADGTPVAMIARSVVAIVGRDQLPGLGPGAPITITSLTGGPLAGAYVVDRPLGGVGGEALRFVAYPTAARDVADLWARGTILLPRARRVPGCAPGIKFAVPTAVAAPVLFLWVDADARGTDPLLEVPILAAASSEDVFEDSGVAFTPCSGGDVQALTLPGSLADAWIQLAPAVSGTEDPSFLCGAVVLDVAVPE